jgi:hypothetical protein
MSDNLLRYVPKDPLYVPTQEQSQLAEKLLASYFPKSDEIRSKREEHVVFVDPGSNWSGVHCSACGADAEAWWGEAMASASEANFSNLELIAPCCGKQVSLNELRYVWPAAFGRYTLEARNPNERGLSLEQAKSLASALGCETHEIPIHL